MSMAGPAGVVTAIVLSFYTTVRATDCGAGNPGDFSLWLIDRTGVEVALGWQAVDGATGYTLQRSTVADFSTALEQYAIASAVTAYGDTSARPMSYYRVIAQLGGGSEQYSNCVGAGVLQPSEPRPRGIAGDLWADVVLGKPDFSQNTFGKTSARGTQWAGGVVLDRHHTPNRMYVADTNHNRILGFDHIGRCAGLQSDIALGKSYTKSALPSASYPDSGGQEFTDSQDAGPYWLTTTSFGYPHSSTAPVTVDVDIDLGAPIAFDAASLNTGAYVDRYTAQFLDLLGSDDRTN